MAADQHVHITIDHDAGTSDVRIVLVPPAIEIAITADTSEFDEAMTHVQAMLRENDAGEEWKSR